MTDRVPVVLFTYRRTDTLAGTLACLRENGVSLLYVFSDGPARSTDAPAVDAVRRSVRSIDWAQVVLCERAENLGLGRSIRAGVTQVLAEHEMCIVFEDDLNCVTGTYEYLAAALRHYKDDRRVMSVTGWTHPRLTPADVTADPYFDGRAECWVWGTWRRAWIGMDADALTLMRQCLRDGIDPYEYGADLVSMARAEHERNIWAVRFAYHHMASRGLCMRPPWSLVEHMGFGPDATDATQPWDWEHSPLKSCPPMPSAWPEPIEHPSCRALAIAAFGGRPKLTHRLRTRVRDLLPAGARSVLGSVRRRIG